MKRKDLESLKLAYSRRETEKGAKVREKIIER